MAPRWNSSRAPLGPRNRSRSSLRMRLRWANSISTFLRRQREVLVLRYYGDLTEAQVAEVLGVSIGSVKAYGSRGIEALRARMEEHR